jgi:hypothetical protein
LVADEGYVGHDVHRAARIAAAGHGGQVLVSESTAALVNVKLTDLGQHRFKDLAAAERVFQLGDGKFASLKSLYRTNLPVPATPFLGRERELREVVDLLVRKDSRLLTLAGPGGTGKTRLMLQAAAEASDGFPDGVYWIPLAPLRDEPAVAAAIAQALDVGERAGVTLEDSIVASFEDRRALIFCMEGAPYRRSNPGWASEVPPSCKVCTVVATDDGGIVAAAYFGRGGRDPHGPRGIRRSNGTSSRSPRCSRRSSRTLLSSPPSPTRELLTMGR